MLALRAVPKDASTHHTLRDILPEPQEPVVGTQSDHVPIAYTNEYSRVNGVETPAEASCPDEGLVAVIASCAPLEMNLDGYQFMLSIGP